MARNVFALALCIAAVPEPAAAQPAEAPHYLQVVTTAGTRQDLNPNRRELSLSAEELQRRNARSPRSEVRMICARPCPAALPARRPRQDVIQWEDGRRTSGTVFIHDDIVEQNGARAGRLEDIAILELGSAPPDARLARELVPLTIGVIWDEPWGGGDNVVFRRPWLTLSRQEVILHGQPARPRGENLRFLIFGDGLGRRGRQPWTNIDTVVWSDGSQTTGEVTIAGGEIRQAGQRPRPLRDANYMELARRPAEARPAR